MTEFLNKYWFFDTVFIVYLLFFWATSRKIGWAITSRFILNIGFFFFSSTQKYSKETFAYVTESVYIFFTLVIDFVRLTVVMMGTCPKFPQYSAVFSITLRIGPKCADLMCEKPNFKRKNAWKMFIFFFLKYSIDIISKVPYLVHRNNPKQLHLIKSPTDGVAYQKTYRNRLI